MKNLFLALSLSLLIGTVLTLNSCKKESTEDDSVSAQDAATVMKGVANTADDGSAAAGQISTFTGKTEGLYAALCGVGGIDSSVPHQLTLTYSGSGACFGLIRTGQITVALTSGTHWQDVGAQLTITYNNFKITDALGNTYTINGTHTVTNELGGLAWKIAYGLVTNDSTEHRFSSGDMSITFPNGSQRTWAFDRTRKWSNTGGSTVTLTEYTEAPNGVDIQGSNRFGNGFTNTVITPLISNNNHLSCLYLPYQGQLQHKVGSRTTTVTFGTSTTGSPQGTPTVCGAGIFINYYNANNGAILSRFISY
jgi:hypothetical protein